MASGATQRRFAGEPPFGTQVALIGKAAAALLVLLALLLGEMDARCASSRDDLLFPSRAEHGLSANPMDYASSLQCGWAAIHLLGLAATFLVRAYAGSSVERTLQGLFLVGLSGVAVATLAGEQLGWPSWTLSAATMAVMIVAAVADVERSGVSGGC
jgi:hypothetical protein